MKRHVGAAAGLALLLVVSTVSAQPGRGGFGRGFGMGPPSGAMLLGMEEVRTEIGTSDEQNQKIEDLLADVREKMRSAFGDFQGLRDLSEEEREKRIAEFRQKAEEVNKEADAKIAEILDEKQAERLNQLRLQREGVAALARAEVAEKLGLSQEQRDKIAKIQEESSRPQGGFGNFQDMTDEERREFFAQLRERREKAETDIVAVLTEEQKTKWNEMKGEEFTFPERGFGRGQGGERRREPQQRDE